MPIDKRFWTETEKLMEFATKDGRSVVARIYEYRGQQYPVWEKILNDKQSNVWLISENQLDENVSNPLKKGSYPHLRAQGNGYYIYGFRYNLTTMGQSRIEFFRYLAGRRCTPDEWNVCNPVLPISPSSAQNKPATKQAVAKSSPRKSAAPAQPAGTHAGIIKATELQYACAIAERFGVSKPQNGDVNAAVKKWENENPELFHAMFHSADDLERIDQFNAECPDLDYVTQKFALFELVIGDVKNAKMIILNNNPGADSLTQSPEDLNTAVNNFVEYLDIFVKSQQNAGQQNLKNIYYPFDRRFITLNSDYFPKRFLNTSSNASPRLFDSLLRGYFCTSDEKNMIQKGRQYPARYFDIWENAAPYIVSLERFGYHSKYYRRYEDRLQNRFIQQRKEVTGILKSALERPLADRPIILIFRGENAWKKLLGDNFFLEYQKVYFVSNNTSPYASEEQIGNARFQQLRQDWNALVNNPSLKLQ